MGRLMRELEIGTVPLAFRSSFRDWAADALRRPARPTYSPSRTSTATTSSPPDRAATSSSDPESSCRSGPTTSRAAGESALAVSQLLRRLLPCLAGAN